MILLRRQIMARVVFVFSFHCKVCFDWFWSFLIPWFLSVNVLLGLIVCENLWPQQLLFFNVFTSIYFVCMCMCIHYNVFTSIYMCVCVYVYTFSNMRVHLVAFPFLSFFRSWMWVRTYLTPQVYFELVSVCICLRFLSVYVCELQFCLYVCVCVCRVRFYLMLV